jgi:hypothetical protein
VISSPARGRSPSRCQRRFRLGAGPAAGPSWAAGRGRGAGHRARWLMHSRRPVYSVPGRPVDSGRGPGQRRRRSRSKEPETQAARSPPSCSVCLRGNSESSSLSIRVSGASSVRVTLPASSVSTHPRTPSLSSSLSHTMPRRRSRRPVLSRSSPSHGPRLGRQSRDSECEGGLRQRKRGE